MDGTKPRPRRVLVVAVVLFVLVAFLRSVHGSNYLLTPGDALAMGPKITATGLQMDHDYPNAGAYMVDVSLTPMTLWDEVVHSVTGSGETITASDLVPNGVPMADFDRQSYLDMQVGKETAAAQALDALGWRIPTRAAGATVYMMPAASAARASGVRVADRIVSFNGQSIANSCALTRDLHDVAPNTVIRLGLVRAHVSSIGTISYTTHAVASVRTRPTPRSVGVSDCPGISTKSASWIGVELSDAFDVTLPGAITIKTDYIGGPSAGLAMTLALVDRLSSGSLTGVHKVAVTGTIDRFGNVGDVGGVAEKTIAAIRAGASTFIVPAVEVDTARRAANGRMRIIGVNTLAQALAKLAKLGGDHPVPLTKPYPLVATP